MRTVLNFFVPTLLIFLLLSATANSVVAGSTSNTVIADATASMNSTSSAINPIIDQWAYDEIYAICSTTGLITPDFSSIDLTATTELSSYKPFTESLREAVQSYTFDKPSTWLQFILSSNGYQKALNDCYPPEVDKGLTLLPNARLQFELKLFKLDAYGKILARGTFALGSTRFHEYIGQTQRRLREKLKKFSTVNN